MDREEMREVVRETLRQAGIDPDDPAENRADHDFVRNMREGQQRIRRTAQKAGTWALVSTFVAAIVWYILDSLGFPHP